jgi:hypothetical protein
MIRVRHTFDGAVGLESGFTTTTVHLAAALARPTAASALEASRKVMRANIESTHDRDVILESFSVGYVVLCHLNLPRHPSAEKYAAIICAAAERSVCVGVHSAWRVHFQSVVNDCIFFFFFFFFFF